MTSARNAVRLERNGQSACAEGFAFARRDARDRADVAEPAVREQRVKKLAQVIATSPHFSTAAVYQDFVVQKKRSE